MPSGAGDSRLTAHASTDQEHVGLSRALTSPLPGRKTAGTKNNSSNIRNRCASHSITLQYIIKSIKTRASLARFSPMALPSLIMRPLRSPLALGLTLSSAFVAANILVPRPSMLLYCDSGSSPSSRPPPRSASSSPVGSSWSSARIYRQISSGSILGMGF